MTKENILNDLLPFCDIGKGKIKLSEKVGKYYVKMERDGRTISLQIDLASGRIEHVSTGSQRRGYASFRALLASDLFANLRRWSDTQHELLKNLPSASDQLPVHGKNHLNDELTSVDAIDQLLGSQERGDNATEILVIDGPAGIGKTNLIEQIALRRAKSYKISENPKPIVLHVKSRGRILSNLQDLMAFSLQTIRSPITYDQIPILVKHGLVVMAIDGFDELADPNGYETAWAQLAELVASVRGKGTLILAGRDTFIGRSRLFREVAEIREGTDIVNAVTLLSPTPAQAKAWLAGKKNWSEKHFEFPSIAVLLEEDSFALRPVFLRILANHVEPKEIKDKHERYLTPLLVDLMIQREADLFGKSVDASMPLESRKLFLRTFLCEVAREMADSQTESIDASNLAWISETAIPQDLPADIKSLIQNRANVVGFFINDERPGYRTFMHSYLMSYFLSLALIDIIGSKEIPRFLRRNLLGSEFLSVFSDVAAETSASSCDSFKEIFENLVQFSRTYTSADRGLRNIGALMLTALPSVGSDSLNQNVLRDFHVDDVQMRGECPPTVLKSIVIGQLDCCGSDLTSIKWQDSAIIGLIADDLVRVSPTFPTPSKLALSDGYETADAQVIEVWINAHGRRDSISTNKEGLPDGLKKKPIYALLNRVARMRQYWLRSDNDDIQAGKILNDSYWPELRRILNLHDFLREDTRQASGGPSVFYHIKYRERILAEDAKDVPLMKLFAEMNKIT